mgnify:CR=1 FL=1
MFLGVETVGGGGKSFLGNDLWIHLGREIYTQLGDHRGLFADEQKRETLTPIFEGHAFWNSTVPHSGGEVPSGVRSSGENENPPVGILSCMDHEKSLAEYALAGTDNSLFVSKYQLQLPSKEVLQTQLDAERQRLESASKEGAS